MSALAGALAFSLLACARSAPASEHFPVGMYGVNRPGHLEALREAGFDTAHCCTQDAKALADISLKARRLGMRVLACPDWLRGGPASVGAKWPLEAWYIDDEPDVRGLPPEKLARLSAEIKAWDPSRRQAFVIGEGAHAEKYGGVADVLMLDWYPVPHLPLDSVADQLDEALRHIPRGKPVWMVLQAFDWRDYPQHDPKKPRVGRFPDFSEIRFMAYLSILHGARGLFFYSLLNPSGPNLLESPEKFQAVARVAGEIRRLRPALERGERVEALLGDCPAPLECGRWRMGRREIAILLNRGKGGTVKVPAAWLDKGWRPLFEARRDPREVFLKGDEDWYLEAMRVVVLEKRPFF